MSQKGSNFERKICKELSLWATNGVRDDVFWRTSQSGGRATYRRKTKGISTSNSCGDVCRIADEGKALMDLVNIELKRGYSSEINVLDFLDKKGESLLLKWYNKARKEADENNREFVWVIFKRNHKEKMIMIESSFCLILFQDDIPLTHIQLIIGNKIFYFFTLNEFLKELKYTTIITYSKERNI